MEFVIKTNSFEMGEKIREFINSHQLDFDIEIVERKWSEVMYFKEKIKKLKKKVEDLKHRNRFLVNQCNEKTFSNQTKI